MNESSSFGYQQEVGAESSPIPPERGGYPGQHRFSPEELRVLKECNQESFMQRSLPIGTALGLGTFVAVQKGHLKPNHRFGPFPKVTLAVMVGYFVGKLSYQQACAQKLMALPGSYIGQLLRDRKDGKITGTSMNKQAPPSMFGAGPNDIYSDAGPGSSLDLDSNRPMFNDDNFSSNADDPKQSPTAPSSSSSMSYDELRRRNRGAQVEAKQDPYSLDQAPPISRRPAPAPTAPTTNKYGDVVE